VAQEASISEGRKQNARILLTTQNFTAGVGVFDMPQSWEMGQIDFPSKGRHAEDFYTRKIQQLRPGLNPRTREPEASMLTTRPRKPFAPRVSIISKLINTRTSIVQHLYREIVKFASKS
jgi:hypothetical protein